ncbi:PEP/pyruvate-binding domain-containing protein [Desulfobacula sp.]|uniref:PEP/pyruvate-binding domain-containing protein n=1 Tax=Desulfobacula sp. TaxID=2593537 RepID=UPI00262FD068|nr:PEP/pyruvate-binding domain-containing protein [Desulfobacula sp.]
MTPILGIDSFIETGKNQVGGKAFCLARIHDQGVDVPETFCIPCRVYESYIAETCLEDKIRLEMNRKPFKQMRWEEIWDISLRIRNLFLTTPIPHITRKTLAELLQRHFNERSVAIRSSAPGEDDESTSFAGLHASYLNVIGADEILKHVKLVWASLYSDAALLYRKELGLDIHTSKMAVVLQELIPSDRSGVFFGINPSDATESVLESVYGLNQGLVDGDIEPDRWILQRSSGKILSHIEPVRNHYTIPDKKGVAFAPLPQASRQKPPLNDQEVHQIWKMGNKVEALFNRPQDMEWTFYKDRFIMLQTRPITSSGFKEADDKRTWYLSLHRSYENLKGLYDKIETHLIPEMISQTKLMGQVHLQGLSNPQLHQEITKRQAIYDHWVKVYWADFIPFAHGIRLFGQIYNDAVKPQDPYEFMALLENTGLKSVQRNNRLEALADMIRNDTDLKDSLESVIIPDLDHPFKVLLDNFILEFGDLSCSTGYGNECQYGDTGIIRLLLEFAKSPPRKRQASGPDIQTLQDCFLKSFPEEKYAFALDVLHLGRESYRLRDDDNIHLGRIETRLVEAVQEGQSRLADPDANPDGLAMLAALPALSLVSDTIPVSVEPSVLEKASTLWLKARQVVGHPAGPGIASGTARLINTPQDLMDFKQGDVLICPGVDPNMTFVIPLAAAVVEERGGMLIHGAIIAREYGLPCITGATDIMRLIEPGDHVIVDGYLGIITCKTREL